MNSELFCDFVCLHRDNSINKIHENPFANISKQKYERKHYIVGNIKLICFQPKPVQNQRENWVFFHNL